MPTRDIAPHKVSGRREVTLLETPEVVGGAVEYWTPTHCPMPVAKEPRTPRRAGLARIDDLERRALAFADHAGGTLGRDLEALFSEVRDLLSEQFAELDHCLKQAFGSRPTSELPEPGAAEGHAFDRLTVAEKRVFVELAKGKPNKIIAYNLSISEATVKAHVSKILKKLKVHSRNRAIALFASRVAE